VIDSLDRFSYGRGVDEARLSAIAKEMGKNVENDEIMRTAFRSSELGEHFRLDR